MQKKKPKAKIFKTADCDMTGSFRIAYEALRNIGITNLDSYLEIAYRVLRANKRPMTAKGILEAGYKAGIVPEHLYGKTQQKTLQARLSEDILRRRLNSPFFRTEPGYFFLAEFLSDPEVPQKFKEPFSARRRTRDLYQYPSLTINLRQLGIGSSRTFLNWDDMVCRAKESDAIHYVAEADRNSEWAPVWTVSLVRRHSMTLAYRIGRYRDDRDIFADKRTIGFPGLVNIEDRTFFSQSDYGVGENALNVLLSDLDLSPNAFRHGQDLKIPQVRGALLLEEQKRDIVVLVVLEWNCPDWFEPTMRRLSLNNPSWLDLTVRPNDMDDFEPWSVAIIDALQSIPSGHRGTQTNQLHKSSTFKI